MSSTCLQPRHLSMLLTEPHSELQSPMASPIPGSPVDISSKILYKVDAATVDSVTASVVHGWIGELDEAIQATKVGGLPTPFELTRTIIQT